MDELVRELPVVAVVLACASIGPALAFAFLLWRKRRARARRRSPIRIDLLRGPGHTLREQLEEANSDVLADVFGLIVVPLALLAIFLGQSHVRGLQEMMRLAPVYVLLALAVIGYMVWKLVKAGERLDRIRAGFDAEVAVGQELDQLMRQGAVVFHDLPAENFNIDHVVISTEGVFAVETKGFTKPKRGRGKADATVVFDGKALKFPTWTTKEPLEQAERQAAWLAKWVSSAVGSTIHVLPVLALPGWFVERSGRSDVRVFNGKELTGLLKSRGTQLLSTQDVQRVAHQVEQRCRTVGTKYADEERTS